MTSAVVAKTYSEHVNIYSHMLSDRSRNQFFKTQIDRVAKNKVVLDVGTGTGLMAFYALKAGARFVYAVERWPGSASVAERVLSANFDKSRFKVLQCDFWTDEIEGKIQDPIDVLVSETVGPGLFDQGMIHTWHCAQPFMAPNAVYLPDRLHFDLWVWNQHFDLTPNFDPFTRELHVQSMLDQDFAQTLLRVYREDHELRMQQTTTKWAEVHRYFPAPQRTLDNVVSATVNQMPRLEFSDSPYPSHIKPHMSFDFDTEQACTVALIHKISVTDQTLWLHQGKYTLWILSPYFELDRPGRYRFDYNNFELKHENPRDWIYTQI